MKVGQIGLGYWGPKLLRNLVSAVGAENVIACDLNIDRVAAAGKEYPSIGVTLNVDDDVFNNDDVGAVIIATPLSTHAPLVKRAIAAGKHVLVEKPLTSSPEEARELAELAENAGLVLMTGHTFLFSPRVEHVAGLMADGSLGPISYVTSQRLNLGLHRTDANVIWDLASHDISVLLHLMGEQPLSVQTMARSIVIPDVPETAFMNLEFPSGAIASVSVSWRAPRKVRHMAIVGQKQMVVYDDAEAEEPIKVYDKGVVMPDSASFADNQLTYRYGNTTAPYVATSEPLANEIAHFLACVETGIECRSDAKFAIQVVDTLHAADESWKRGGLPVELALGPGPVSRRQRRVCSVAYTHYLSDPRGRREMEALADRGDDVTVLALAKEGEPREQVFGGVRVVGLPIARYRGGGARAYLQSYAAFFLRASAYLARRPWRFDVIHAHSIPEAMVFTGLVPRLFGTKTVLDVHDLSSEAYASRFGGSPRAVALVEKLSLKFADRVVTVHDRYREMIIERGVRPGKVTVVHNTPDERIFPMQAPAAPTEDGRFRVVYHGSLLRRYGLEVAVRAVAQLRDRIPGITFEIYGDGDFRADVVRLVDELGLQDVVRLSDGPVPVDQIAAAVTGAHVGLVPFLPEPFTETILPTKLLEYVRLGIPAVVARNPVIERYFADDAVHYVEPGAIDCVVKAVEGVYGDYEGALAGAVRAQQFFDSYSWERDRGRLYEMIDEVSSK